MGPLTVAGKYISGIAASSLIGLSNEIESLESCNRSNPGTEPCILTPARIHGSDTWPMLGPLHAERNPILT